MYEELPVRNDNELWAETGAEMYAGRKILQTELRRGVSKSNMKESYILTDPNIAKGEPNENYKPQIAQRDNVIELGDYTLQRFSGEASHKERAGILQRRSKMVSAVIEALKIANEVEVIESDMTAEKLFNYLHNFARCMKISYSRNFCIRCSDYNWCSKHCNGTNWFNYSNG
jgi:hypothetical protein